MEHIYKLLRSFKWDCAKYLYKNTLNFKVKRLRRKKNIRVLFAVAESATWKRYTGFGIVWSLICRMDRVIKMRIMK